MNPLAENAAPAVFLDRDGTLNREKCYLCDWSGWEWLPGVLDGLKTLQNAGFKLIVASNQSGIARGYYDQTQLLKLQGKINEDLLKRGIQITAFYYCPHHPDYTGDCPCRKPKPGMLLQAAKDLRLTLAESWMLGDKASDAQAGLAAGCRCILLESGYGKSEKKLLPPEIPVCPDFGEAVRLILAHKDNSHA